MSFFENTRKPVGLGGKLMVAMMNLGHSPVARWGLQFLNAAPDAKVLDCGCGGGANMKRLLKKCPQGIVKGIDYSPVSVEKTKKVNETAIAEGDYNLMTRGALRLSYLREDSKVVVGDTVETSGRGGVFPKGILIGTVESVQPEESGLSYYAVIKPFVSVDSVSSVSIITEYTDTAE